MSGKVTGIVFVTVNDKLLQSKSGASLVLGGYERTAQTGHSLYGFSDSFVPAEMECVISDKAQTDLIEMANWMDATLTFETDTGKRYLVRGAATVEAIKLTGGDGDVALKMQGMPAQQELP